MPEIEPTQDERDEYEAGKVWADIIDQLPMTDDAGLIFAHKVCPFIAQAIATARSEERERCLKLIDEVGAGAKSAEKPDDNELQKQLVILVTGIVKALDQAIRKEPS